MRTNDISPTLERLFSELVDGASRSGAFILNSGDIGLRGSLEKISVAQASRSDNVEVAAEVPAVRSRFLRLEQTNDRKIVCELAGRMVALLARFGLNLLTLSIHMVARQAALRDVRHAKCELEGDEMVQGFGVLMEDGVTQVLFELAGLLGELRVGIGTNRSTSTSVAEYTPA